MSAAAVIALRRKRLVRRFRQAGATDSQHAVTPESLGERRSWIFNQMVEHGAFVHTEGDKYYLDEAIATEFLEQRRLRGVVIAGILLFVFLLLWIFGAFK